MLRWKMALLDAEKFTKEMPMNLGDLEPISFQRTCK
jgi:hypothetical protein